MMKNGKAAKVRLEGIDCPELGQDFGTRAKQFTSSMVFRKTIVVKECSKDIYGREIVRIYVEGLDLSLELVKAGLAWYFNAFTSDPALAAAEKAARKQEIGLWSMPNPIPPWVYRRQHRREMTSDFNRSAISDGEAWRKNNSTASLRFCWASLTDFPWLAISSSGH